MFRKSLLKKTDDDVELWITEKSDGSSAKSLAFVVKPSGKSLIYTKNNKGRRFQPCETPTLIFNQFEH